jgi:uncharacterized protein involved in outer membrane biogenesis
MKLEAEAEGGGGKASLKGTLSGQQKNRKLALDFTLGGQRLGDLAAWTGLSPDAGGPYALDGGLVLDGNRWQFSIRSMALGRSRLSGKVGMGPGETRVLLTASLHAKLLDLAELKEILPEESSQSPEESSDVSQGGLADIPDVDLDLSIDRLPSAMGDITDLQAVLSMREGQVREAPFRAVFDGALYQGDLQMTLDDGRVAAGFFLSAEGVDGGSLLEKSGAATDTEAHIGKARLELHVAGKSPEDLVDSLRLTAWIEDSDLTLPDPHTDETIHLGVNRLMLEIASAGKVKMQLDGNLGEHPVSAEGDLLISQGTDMAPGNTSASVQVTGFGGSFHLDGSLPFPFSPVGTEMVFSLTGESLERFNPLMDVSLPPFGPIKVQGRLSIDQEGLHFTDTVIKVGETEIRSLVRTIRRGEKPRMEVEFRSDRLQLNDFSLKGWSPVEIKEETASPSEEPEKIEMAPALHPEVLRRAEGKLTIEAAEVYSGEHKIGSASLEGNLENDRLDLTLDLKTFTGDVILDAGFDASAETTSTDFFLAVENFDYGRLTEAMKSENPNKGRIAGIMELTSRGDDFSRIMENATGRIDFTVWPIGVRSRIFNFWAENVFLAILPAIGTERAARVNCVVGLFDLKDGLMKPKNLIIDTSTVRVRGSGQVDMKTGSLELTLRPTAKSPQFFTLAAPVSVTGTMSDPKVALAPLSLAGIYIRHALSIFTVPLRWVFEKKMPADGSDVCHPPPDERVKK